MMFEPIMRLLPPSLLLGILLYGAICAMWLQPLVETRLAAKIFVPQCEAGVQQAESAAIAHQQNEATRKRDLIGAYADLMGPLGEIPEVRDMVEAAEDLIELQTPTLPAPKRQKADTSCGCAVGEAFDAIRWPMLAHVMTARFYQPASLKALPLSAASILSSGRCGSI